MSGRKTLFFFAESLGVAIAGLVGAAVLIWLSRRRPYRLRAGDQILIFFMWYAVVRFLLENLRTGNWFVGGIPTAQIMSVLFALGAFLILLYRHRRPASTPMSGDEFADDAAADDPAADDPAADEGTDTERPRTVD